MTDAARYVPGLTPSGRLHVGPGCWCGLTDWHWHDAGTEPAGYMPPTVERDRQESIMGGSGSVMECDR